MEQIIYFTSYLHVFTLCLYDLEVNEPREARLSKFNPLHPDDALKHQFAYLKGDLIS